MILKSLSNCRQFPAWSSNLQYYTESFGQRKIVKLLFWTFFNILAASPLSAIPNKLRLYQNVTGIDDFKLMNIYEQSVQGFLLIELINIMLNECYLKWLCYIHNLCRSYFWVSGKYTNTSPRFRYTGIAPSGATK